MLAIEAREVSEESGEYWNLSKLQTKGDVALGGLTYLGQFGGLPRVQGSYMIAKPQRRCMIAPSDEPVAMRVSFLPRAITTSAT